MSTITLITGANQGVGLATALKLAKTHNHHVIIGSRNAEAGAKAAAQVAAEGGSASSVQLDLGSDASIAAAVKTIETAHGHIDVLVNNAGILIDGKNPEQATRDLFTETFNTNVIGTAVLTEAFIPLIRKSANPRIVFVSSRMGSLQQATVKDTPFYAIDYKAYDASKAALNMLALNYVRILEDVDAKVNVACPQLVKTNLTGWTDYGITPEQGAERIVELATLQKGDKVTATFSDRDGEIAW
ncbi:carbonyl reductase [Boeremia exigua]|uniref:carbonyl reductase n=1 Tax=Boeremia exigua TaxID=749465 RepID=UPI001E8D8B8F|nr:carbonyl reductase [Boeremia exigua]KAH6643234.1 carbonyl reductase [Boeremia exigua]